MTQNLLGQKCFFTIPKPLQLATSNKLVLTHMMLDKIKSNEH